MRVLVCIAHHGHKNRPFLDRMLTALRATEHQVDIVVLTEAPKHIPGVEELVGLPTGDPWSLPFGHRTVFADRVDDYDLFVYSEDDTLVTQRHMDTYLECTRAIPDTHLVGFMRYEVDAQDRRSYATLHSYYRWAPPSTFSADGLTFAEFTNAHAACYMLTRAQLRRAIASGQYLVPPHRGEYDMLVSAATDPYTRCGFRKVICLERIDDLLVHHMPNVYLGRMGVSEASFRAQVEAMTSAAAEGRAPLEYLRTETRLPTTAWHKRTYPKLPDPILPHLPAGGRLLSLAATDGRLEATLQHQGWDVTALPVDDILGAAATTLGVHVLPATSLLRATDVDGPFDCALALDVLPYLPDPAGELRALRSHLVPGGRLLVTVPDHRRYAARNLVTRRQDRVPLPRTHAVDGMHFSTRPQLRRWLTSAGFEITRITRRRATRADPVGRGGSMARLKGNAWLAEARVTTSARR